jgi:predicted aspartyl protease
MTMRKLAAFVLLCITPFYSKAAVNVVFHDGIEFSEAIKNGDSQTIQQFLQSNPDIGLLPVFKSGLYRISGNLTQSTAFAEKCYIPGAVSTKSARSMLCGLLMAGNDLNEGRIADWAGLSQRIKAETAPVYLSYIASFVKETAEKQRVAGLPVSKADYTLDIFSVVSNYSLFEKWPYTTQVHIHDTTSPEVPIIWRGDVVNGYSNRRPFVRFQVNGKMVEGLLDTGISNNLLLNHSDANLLGITHITPGWIPLTGMDGKKIPTSLGNASTLQLGDATFTNLPVTVAGNSMPIIGLNLLRQLGSVSLSDQTLTISPPQTGSCSSPLRMTSFVSGSIGTLLTSIQLQGNQVDAAIDTGAPMLVYKSVDAIPSLQDASSNRTKPGRLNPFLNSPDVPYVTEQGDFSILGIGFHNIAFPIFQHGSQFLYGVGADMLRTTTYVMDFRNGHLCVESKNS